MSSFAATYLQNQVQREESSAVSILLKRFLKDPNISVEEKEQIEVALGKSEHSVKNLVNVYREKLKRAHLEYPEPKQSFSDAIEEYEMFKAERRDALKTRLQGSGDDAELAKNELLLGEATLHEPTVETKGAFYAFDPATGKRKKEPLAYPLEIEWSQFEKYVKKNPYTKTLNLHGTLMKFLEIGKEKGLTRKQLMELIKLLLFHERPENYTSVSQSEDPFRVFEVTLGLIDYNTHLAKLRVALKKVERRPEECVKSVMGAYSNIVQELLQVQCPDSTETQNEDLADKEALRAIKHFITPDMNKEVQIFKEMYKNMNNQKPAPLQEIFDFIQDCEDRKPEIRPKTVLTMGANVTIDLFLTDQSRHHTWDLGLPDPDTEGESEWEEDLDDGAEMAFVSETNEPSYSNWPGGAGQGTASAAPASEAGSSSSSSVSSHLSGVTSPLQSVNMAASRSKKGGGPKTGMSTRSKGPSSANVSNYPKRRNAKPKGAAKNLSASAGRSTGTVSPGRSRRDSSGSRSERGRPATRPVTPSRITAYSPDSGKKRLYGVSPGGRAYAIPRQSLHTYDKKTGGFVPRSRSASKETKSKVDPSRCEVCYKRISADTQHICDYGKIRSKRECSKCRRGKHPSSVCLGLKSRSPSRDRDSEKVKGNNKLMPKFNSDLN